MSQTKIVISGIGGVGGYVGGMLALHYEHSNEVSIHFFARGENEQQINHQGLLLDTPSGRQTAHPAQITSDAAQIGSADVIICCTKSYDLLQNLQQLKPCIHQKTVILPLLNGVNHRQEIQQVLPDNEVWEGCIYIIARLAPPGVVQVTSKIAQVYFGASDGSQEKMRYLEKLCQAAGIDAHYVDDIQYKIWEKYLFISSTATLTSYLDVPLGQIKGHQTYVEQLQQLLGELIAVAKAKNIIFPDDIIEKTISRLDHASPDATTSMHSDFHRGKNTEVEYLTGDVVRMGKTRHVAVPVYEKMYTALLHK